MARRFGIICEFAGAGRIFNKDCRNRRGCVGLSEVKVYDDQLEKALKILKRKLAQDGTFKEIKRRRFYEKPSVKKKRKRAEAAKRRAKASKKSTRRTFE
ncbi:MAG: 30S ribosomal protein S21 [Deltaproteobacteria bacterium]|nr:30S ribosomal protein S21 [Deltaproteobacteria bacterium]